MQRQGCSLSGKECDQLCTIFSCVDCNQQALCDSLLSLRLIEATIECPPLSPEALCSTFGAVW